MRWQTMCDIGDDILPYFQEQDPLLDPTTKYFTSLKIMLNV